MSVKPHKPLQVQQTCEISLEIYFYLNLAQLGLVLLKVDISTWRGFPTAEAKEKFGSLTKYVGFKSGKEIQAIAWVVSSSTENLSS